MRNPTLSSSVWSDPPAELSAVSDLYSGETKCISNTKVRPHLIKAATINS